MNELIIILKSDRELTKDIVKDKLNNLEIENPIYVHKICAFTSDEELDLFVEYECDKDEISNHINKILIKNNPDIDKSIISIICLPIKYYKDKIIEI